MASRRLLQCFRSSSSVFAASLSTKMTVTSYAIRVENSSSCIDLRSDTITLPSAEMRRAMADAILGDDVYGEDPLTNELEERCAKLFGKEAGLFVCSGTMGNLLAVMAHCQRGDEIIVGRYNHIHRWEQGNYAQLAGISATTLEVKPDGTMDLADIEESIRVNDSHMPTTRLICIENTHNYTGGKALSLEYLRSLKALAERRGLKVHMDGARIYNAAVALGCSIAEIAQYADSVQMCFSKGLGAPIGSIVVGDKNIVDLARRRRKAVGGGWRQSGILAAAAHVALDHAEATIKADHERAARLAKALNQIVPENLKEKFSATENDITNMVLLNCRNGITVQQIVEMAKARGVLVMAFDSTRIRAVLNWGVDDQKLDKIVEVFTDILQELSEKF